MNVMQLVLGQIDALFAVLSAQGRVAFEASASAIIANAQLDATESKSVQERVQKLAEQLEVVLTNSDDLARSHAICRRAADRLKASVWWPGLLLEWPAPISHEVKVLADLLSGFNRGGQPSPEASLLQLRDVTETLIRLPTSILARRALDCGGEIARTVRRDLITLRGGKWLELARNCSKLLWSSERHGPLEPLVKLFLESNPFRDMLTILTEARNDHLGHGAMRPNPVDTASLVCWFVTHDRSERLQFGARAGVSLIEGLEYASTCKPWYGLQLEAVGENGLINLIGATQLSGWQDDAQHIHHSNRTLPVRLNLQNGHELSLGPFVSARICTQCGRRDVFLFDSVYRTGRWRFDFVDYGRGHKIRLSGDHARDMLQEIKTLTTAEIPTTSDDLSLHSGSAIARLDRLRLERRYLSPAYLRKDLANFISSHDRGVYWLQASAHIGKTTFVQGLAEADLADGQLVNGIGPGIGGNVAVFYCKREYREGRLTFLNGLASQLKIALDLRQDNDRLFPEPRDVIEALNPEQAMADWLEKWLCMSRSTKRLLVVVDGIDEAGPPSEGDSLLTLLPHPNSLAKGIFLLLTSRSITDYDCPDWVESALKGCVNGTDACIRSVKLKDPDYVSLLGQYVERTLGFKNSIVETSLIINLIEQASYRFVFLSFLVEQLRGGQVTIDTVSALGSGENIYNRFIDLLPDHYGSKRGSDLTIILSVLAGAELAHGWTFGIGAINDQASGGVLEALPRSWPGVDLELLAFAAMMDGPAENGGASPTVAFIEALILLQGILWVWRGQQGEAHYRLGLKDLATRFAERRPSDVRRAQARLADACLDAVEALDQLRQAGQTAAPAEELRVRSLLGLLPGLVALTGSDTIRHRALRLPVADIAMGLEMAQFGLVAPVPRQVIWYSAEIAIRVHFEPADHHLGVIAISNAYANRGMVKLSAATYGPLSAIPDYDAAMALKIMVRDALGDRWTIEMCDDLAQGYAGRGDVKQSVGGINLAAAIADYDEAIKLLEGGDPFSIWKRSPKRRFDLLARIHASRGQASLTTLGPKEAISHYDIAIRYWEVLREAQPEQFLLEQLNSLYRAYQARGAAKINASEFGPIAAIEDLDFVIRSMEQLREEMSGDWPSAWDEDIAAAYNDRGIAKRVAPDHGALAAKADYDVAILLRETLLISLGANTPISWRHALAQSYNNRGNIKCDMLEYGHASSIADYDESIRLMVALGLTIETDLVPSWQDDLIGFYKNRGKAKRYLVNYGPLAALDDYDEALRLQEELAKQEESFARSVELARTYVRRANVRQNAFGENADAAIEDFEIAIRLLEMLRDRLGQEWPKFAREHLIEAYMACGKSKYSAPEYGPGSAIQAFNEAITLLEEQISGLEESEVAVWLRALADAYDVRSHARHHADGYDSDDVINDCDAAIVLREELRKLAGGKYPTSLDFELAASYHNRGLAKHVAPAHGPAAAIVDYDVAISLLKSLHNSLDNESKLQHVFDLASMYSNRGKSLYYVSNEKLDAAIADFNIAIRLFESVGDELGSAGAESLANAYLCRAKVKLGSAKHGPEAAVRDYRLAIQFSEVVISTLGENALPEFRHDLANIYVALGDAKYSIAEFESGSFIADYTKAIEILEWLRHKLGQAWPWSWEHDLATAYNNRGFVKTCYPEYGATNAIGDFDIAIKSWEAMRTSDQGEWSPAWYDGPIRAYNNRGAAKWNSANYPKWTAFVDYDAAISLQEELRDTMGIDFWPLSWSKRLLGDYEARAHAKLLTAEYGSTAAISDYDLVIRLREHLGDKLAEDWCSKLAAAYLERGDARQNSIEHGSWMALEDYDAAILLKEDLRRTLGAEFSAAQYSDLAETLMSRGNIRYALSGFGPAAALADYTRAIDLWTMLRDAARASWQPVWSSDLAAAYNNRGSAKEEVPAFDQESAIADFTMAIGLLEALRASVGEDDWRPAWSENLRIAYKNRSERIKIKDVNGS